MEQISGKYRMTQKLEELFDLPNSDGILDSPDCEPGNDIEKNLPILPESLDALDKIEQALPAVRGLEASDIEMDALATKATESFDNLMDLGMQVDSRYASEIFSVASQMLGHAITAKTAKMNKKLKMIDLQLKKARLDQIDNTATTVPNGDGRVIDRNELLRHIKEQIAEKPNNGK
jgi:vancomycin resistance protein YoaR